MQRFTQGGGVTHNHIGLMRLRSKAGIQDNQAEAPERRTSSETRRANRIVHRETPDQMTAGTLTPGNNKSVLAQGGRNTRL